MRTDGYRASLEATARLILTMALALVLTSACANTTTSNSLAESSTATASGTPVTPSPDASPATPAATIDFAPTQAPGGGGVKLSVTVQSSRVTTARPQVTFHPNPSIDHPDGTRASTKYHGSIWPSQWNAFRNTSGQLVLTFKIPRVLQQQESDNLWLVEPGPHLVTISVDGSRIASATFTVIAPPPAPSALSQPEVIYHDLWPVDPTTVWLTGERCQGTSLPTPDAYGNIPAPPPPVCQGLLEVSHDAGETWTARQFPAPDQVPTAIAFADATHGLLITTTTSVCGQGPCSSVIYQTADGGQHWEAVYHTGPNSPDLMRNGHPVIAESVSLTRLVFSNPNDAWAFGRGCASGDAKSCQPVLLATNDGGISWSQVALPELACPCSAMAHPTSADGWILASSASGTPKLVTTHNAGQSWTEIPDPAGHNGVFSEQMTFRSAILGWLLSGSEPGAGEQAKTLYQTTDGGKTWTKIASAPFGKQSQGLPSSGYVGPMLFSTTQTGWMMSPRMGLLRSTDGGRHWTSVSSIGYQESLQDVRFSGAMHGWLLSSRQLWRTADGGASWQAIPIPGSAP